MLKPINIQYGCGLCAPPEWVNFDSSPTIKLQRLPLIGGVFQAVIKPLFPREARYGDIVKGLPFSEKAAARIYCSHILEHLALDDLRKALKESYRLLNQGGVFRLVLPDLEYYIDKYRNSQDILRGEVFIDETRLGAHQRNRTVSQILRNLFGGAQHLWMWDYIGMKAELEKVGFHAVRRAHFGDSHDPAFAEVEDKARWENCLGVECRR